MMKQWIDLAISRGHTVHCVTARRDTNENIDIVYDWLKEHGINIKVFFTSLRSKIEYMEERGVHIDVWMDDSPITLVNGH